MGQEQIDVDFCCVLGGIASAAIENWVVQRKCPLSDATPDSYRTCSSTYRCCNMDVDRTKNINNFEPIDIILPPSKSNLIALPL